jgi:hypothetical protein
LTDASAPRPGATVRSFLLSSDPNAEASLDHVRSLFPQVMSSDALHHLRDALTATQQSPLVTLEELPMPASAATLPQPVKSLGAASPLAAELTRLVGTVAKSGGTGETLYRMQAPAHLAGQLGRSVRPMQAAGGGIHGALMGSRGIVGQAAFVPAATAGGAVLVASAAPLVLLAVGTAVAVSAEQKQQETLHRVHESVEKLHEDALHAELDKLEAAAEAVGHASDVLLDEGQLTPALGLDSTVRDVGVAVQTARRRVSGWSQALRSLDEGGATRKSLMAAFPGLGEVNGRFEQEFRIARLAIELHRRSTVVQAVAQGQADREKSLRRFLGGLQRRLSTLDELESKMVHTLESLSAVPVSPGHRLSRQLFTRKEMQELLQWQDTLRALPLVEFRGGLHEGSDDVGFLAVRREDGALSFLPSGDHIPSTRQSA